MKAEYSHSRSDQYEYECRVSKNLTPYSLVLNDPHLPWERYAGSINSVVDDPTGTTPSVGKSTLYGPLDNAGSGHLDPDKRPLYRQQVPWIALVVFDPSELALSGDEQQTLASSGALAAPNADEIKHEGSSVTVNTAAATLPATGAYPMAVADYLKLKLEKSETAKLKASTEPMKTVFTRINYEAGTSEIAEIKTSTEPMKAIFPTQALCKSLFGDISKHKYLAHVRNINTTGMPDAGVQDDGLFSIVISHRTGPYDLTQPKTQIVHLVSIEFMDSTLSLPGFGTDSTSRVGLVSLFSWIYTALPPNPVNFVDSMINLGNFKQYLNPLGIPAQDPIPGTSTPWGKLDPALVQRLRDGYVFSRYRVQTGEESVCLNRGPLVPVTIPSNGTSWPGNSNYSTDYQVLDKQLGVIDISYSSAFQLGKTMAIADRVFCQALMRIRATMYSTAASETLVQVTGQQSKRALASNISSHVDKMANLSHTSPNLPVKWTANPPKKLAPNLSLSHPDAQPILRENIRKRALLLASSADGTIYNEFNLANNTDWPVILSWVMDRLFLANIPAHHLFVDPSHLPMEALRLFHIDDTWLDCLIDGALSVANHLDQRDDQIRRHIKMAINEYLKTPVPPKLTYTPQVPSYGFVIRSAVVKAFPDLKISIKYNNDNSEPDAQLTDDGRARICRLTNIDDTTLLCLLDRKPEEIEEIQFSQPHHQQRYSLGNYLNATELEFEPRQLYTQNVPVQPKGEPPTGWPSLNLTVYHNSPVTTDHPSIYNWATRCIQVDALAKQLQDALVQDTHDYTDSVTTSVVIGLELNDPSYYLLLTRPASSVVLKRNPRQLWLGIDPGPDPSPVDPARVPAAHGGGGTDHPTTPAIPTPTSGPLPVIPRAPSNPTNVSVVTKNIIQGPGQSGSRNDPVGTAKNHFIVAVYPDYATQFPTPNDAKFTIATDNIYLMDLIISIRRDHPADPKVVDALREITVNIPIASSDQKGEPLLKNYVGPGATMLSNQRYNVLLNRSTTNLQCRVVPRGKESQPINDSKTDELSFKLSECYINEIKTMQNKQPPGGVGPVIKNIGISKVGWIESYQLGGRVQMTTEKFIEVYKAKRQDVDPATGEKL